MFLKFVQTSKPQRPHTNRSNVTRDGNKNAVLKSSIHRRPLLRKEPNSSPGLAGIPNGSTMTDSLVNGRSRVFNSDRH